MKDKNLFTSLSLISSFSRFSCQNKPFIQGVSIEKNSTSIIEGVYSNFNDFFGINVEMENKEIYFYTFDLEDDGKILKNGNQIQIKDLNIGDNLKITYDGSVSLIYPAKLNNVTKIEVV